MSKSKLKSTTAPPLEHDRMLSRGEVLEIVNVTYPCLWGWVKDGHFPAPRQLGFKGKRGRIGWLSSEVQTWVASRPRRFPKGTKLKEVALA